MAGKLSPVLCTKPSRHCLRPAARRLACACACALANAHAKEEIGCAEHLVVLHAGPREFAVTLQLHGRELACLVVPCYALKHEDTVTAQLRRSFHQHPRVKLRGCEEEGAIREELLGRKGEGHAVGLVALDFGLCRTEDELGVRMELLRGELQQAAVLHHGSSNELPVPPQLGSSKLQGIGVALHSLEHQIATGQQIRRCELQNL
mmetsp:Transcript_71934/g.232736  ORF Transcript_71934/g.232736 Transcript_71934/m.232736 type:complete len:205 (+) Transcript_71934:145-759(+)